MKNSVKKQESHWRGDSFVGRILCFISIMLFLLLFLLIIYTFNSFRMMREREEASVRSTLQIYAQQLDSKFVAMDQCLEGILGQSNLIRQMSHDREAERYFASVELQNDLKNYILNNSELDYFLIMERQYQGLVAASSTRMKLAEKEAVHAWIGEYAQPVQDGRPKWDSITLNGEDYIAKMYSGSDWSVAAFSKMDTFLADVRAVSYPMGQSFLLCDGDGLCMANLEDGRDGYVGSVLPEEEQNRKQSRYIQTLNQGKTDVRLVGVISWGGIWKRFGFNSVFIGLIMICAIGCNMVILSYIQREIHQPLKHLMKTIADIEEGDYKQRAEEHYRTRELQSLTSSFNRMMDVIVNLRIRAYDEKIRLMDTQMKYFQMQIKPHFFLNALTTIYSMSYQKRDADIRSYIDALTKTVRYMFKTGLHTVPLKEELMHLRNYFQMQELRYPDCVFWYFEVGKEAEEWEIPQMLLHTFIENEYKYAVRIDSLLSILIRAEVICRNGEKLLLVRMEDDGVGFPEEVIRYINFKSEDPSREGRHVGLWNIKRTLEVIYQREGLLHLSNLETGGCLIEIQIPKRARIRETEGVTG